MLDFVGADGKRVRRVLSEDRRVAERIRAELVARRNMQLDGLGSIAGQGMTLQAVADLYLADLGARVTPHHIKNVRLSLRRSMEVLGAKQIRDLRPADVVQLRAESLGRGASNRTANLVASRLQAALRWAVENRIIAENPLSHLRPLPTTADHRRYRRRALSEEEIQRFLEASEEDDRRNELRSRLDGLVRIPQTPLWLALLLTGARWNEARQIRWADVDLKRRLLVLRAESTTSRKARVIPLREDFVDVLVALRARQERLYGRLPNAADLVLLSPEGMPWGRPSNNPMRILDRVLRRAGIAKVDALGEKLDLHALRHTFATRLARSGAALMHTQRLLGHSDPKLTAQVYSHLDAEDLRGAIDSTPSLGGIRAKRRAR
jgi:integrase